MAAFNHTSSIFDVSVERTDKDAVRMLLRRAEARLRELTKKRLTR